MSNAPILITGARGQVGRALSVLLGKKAVAATRERADLAQPDMLASLIDELQPSAIINAAAYTQVDKAESERDLAFKINADAPKMLASIAAERNIPFVHYSTDYVFDGLGNTPRTEDAPCAPLNVYGESKLAGEQAVITANPHALIFRTSWVYDAVGTNFFTTMLKLAAERTSLSVVNDQIGAPTYAPHIAQATMEALVDATHDPASSGGIYHLCNAGETSWYGFACAIFQEALDAEVSLAIEECSAIPTSQYPTPATRPLNSRLNCDRLADRFDVALPHWQDGLDDAMEHFINHTLPNQTRATA